MNRSHSKHKEGQSPHRDARERNSSRAGRGGTRGGRWGGQNAPRVAGRTLPWEGQEQRDTKQAPRPQPRGWMRGTLLALDCRLNVFKKGKLLNGRKYLQMIGLLRG